MDFMVSGMYMLDSPLLAWLCFALRSALLTWLQNSSSLKDSICNFASFS
jgi:hypothetical protein